METQLEYGTMRYLKLGRKLLYRAGEAENFIKANVEVAAEPGITAVSVRIVNIVDKGSAVTIEAGIEVLASPFELYFVNEYKSPKNDPHWVQASRVVDEGGGYFKVWRGEKYYGILRAGWSNIFMDKSKSDCLVEDNDLGWLKIWWNDADVEQSDS